MELRFDYRPTDYQQDFHRARWKYPYRWLCAGFGTGKTYSAVAEDLFYTQVLAPGLNGIIIVPDYVTFDQVVLDKIEELWPPDIWRMRNVRGKPELQVRTPKGISKIFVRAGHNRRSVRTILGLEASWAHVEEAGRIFEGRRAWDLLLQRLRGPAIEYTDVHGVSHRIQGPVHVSGTPWPGWLPEEFCCGEGHPPHALTTGYSNDGKHYVRQARTKDNYYLPQETIDRAYEKGEDHDWVRQEANGEIIQATLRILHNFHREVHVIPHRRAMEIFERTPRENRGGGVDFGWSPDPAALIWGAWVKRYRQAVIVGEFYKHRADVEEQAYCAWKAQRQLGIRSWYHPHDDPGATEKWRKGFYFDPSGQGRPPGRFSVSGVMDADNSRRAGFSALRNLCCMQDGRPGLLVSDQCENFIREAIDLRRASDMDGRTVRDGDTEGDDHAVDAGRYWLHTSSMTARSGTAKLLH